MASFGRIDLPSIATKQSDHASIGLERQVRSASRTARRFGEPGIVDYRNPVLAEVMKVLGYVQRFGVGIATARAALTKNGNPPPEFVVQPNRVQCVVRRRP